MVFTIFLMSFTMFYFSGLAQKNWEALKVGGNGAKYKITHDTYKIRHEYKFLRDTSKKKINL